MARMIKGLLLSFVLVTLCSSTLSANTKTLLVDGVYAGGYGDVGLDYGLWRRDEPFAALRLKAGFQLIRYKFVGLTLGYQKSGFFTAEKNLKPNEARSVSYDYRGPVLELHFFPSSLFSLSLAAHRGVGYNMEGAENVSAFPVQCETDASCLATRLERSKLSIEEYTAQVMVRIKAGLYLFLGGGSRAVQGEPAYEVPNVVASSDGSSTFESFGAEGWQVKKPIYMFGIRGSTL